MTYSLRIHPLAEEDAERIVDYLAARSVQGALNWLDVYLDAQSTLRKSPLTFSVIADTVSTSRVYRQIFFKTKYGQRYRAVYAVEGSDVTILRLRIHGQQPLANDDLPTGE